MELRSACMAGGYSPLVDRCENEEKWLLPKTLEENFRKLSSGNSGATTRIAILNHNKRRVMKKIQGLHPYRFRKNPEEKRFAGKWSEQNKHATNCVSTLGYLLWAGEQTARLADGPPEASDRDHTVATTVIQWLGSPVGQAFLRDIGYEKR